MNKVFIVQGLGLGNDEDQFENVSTFTSPTMARLHVATLRREHAAQCAAAGFAGPAVQFRIVEETLCP